LADIVCLFHELNKSLHDFRTTAFSFHDKTKSSRRIGLIIKEVEIRQVSCFPFLDSFISYSEIQLNPELAANIKEHCEKLTADFKDCFPENLKSKFWIRDAFSIVDILTESVITDKRDQLKELSCD
jgi:hypothetical protein